LLRPPPVTMGMYLTLLGRKICRTNAIV
jgi:hypothetical protein